MKKHFTFILILCIYSMLGQLHAQQVEDVVTGLNNPFGLAFYENELYISSQNVTANPYSGKIVKVDPSIMNPVPEVVVDAPFSTSMVVYNGFLYVTEISSIQRFDLSAASPSLEPVLTGLNFPNGLLVIDDELFFCQTATGSVDKIDLTQSTPTPETVVAVGQGLSGPIALAHQEGTLYIAESDNAEISTINLSDASPSPTSLLTGLTGILDMHIDGDYMYVAIQDEVARFSVLNASPTADIFVNNLDAPHGLIFADGELYVTELALGKVVKITGISPAWSALASVCSSSGSVTLDGASPTGGVYSGAGVTDNGDGETFAFDPTAAGGAGTYPITYTVSGATVQSSVEVVAGPDVSFTAPGPFEPDAGLQLLAGGIPSGGVYTGTGVVDNGDGTYSFDPATGVGTYTITYTLTDGNGCSGSAMADIVVESCELPVINGINIVDCGTDFSGVTLEIDGELNGAAQWEWTAASFGNIPCEELDVFVTGTTLSGAGFTAPDSTYYIRAAGGCLDAPVCLAYSPSEILGAPNIGGTVALADGTADITFCIEIDGTNELSFAATGNSGDNFTFLITDQSNNIEAFDNTGVFDFATLDDGTYRIWGLSYSGNLLLGVGDNPVSDPVSDKCYDLSDNFISVTAKIANAGSIGVIGAGAENDVCVGDGIDDNYSFLFQGSEGSSPFFSSYALTDDNDALLQFPISSPFNFETLPAGNYRVRTVLYTGNLTLNLGDNLTTTPISDDCYDFSGNFIAFNLSAVPTVTFTAPGPFAPDAGIQPLTGGMPEGGTYSGPGVINNGDGTYSFDPSIGLGSYTITYTFEVAACNTAANTTDVIIVEEFLLSGDICMDPIDINSQFGQAPNETQSSGPYDNTNATTDASDPIFGWECFGEPDGNGGAPSLERTLWFTFVGDGNEYFIEALACGDDPIDFSDTQFAIYAGSCDSLEAVLCSEDGPNAAAGYFPAGDTLQTEAGVTYYMMIDGFGPDFAADGEFCIETTLLSDPVELTAVTFQVDASILVDDGSISADGMYIAGGFNDFNGEPMTEGADNVWSITLELEQGAIFTYKFQNGPGGWETIDTSIGEDCTVGGYGDREVTVGDMDMTLDLVCFGYCVSCPLVDVDEVTLEAGVSVFPNPAKDVLNVQIDLPQAAGNLNIRMINTLGQIVSDQYFGQLQIDNIELDLSKIPAGAYMLQVRDGQSQFTQSVIVQK